MYFGLFLRNPYFFETKKNRSEIASSFPAVARLDLSHVSENKGFGNSQTPTFGGRRRRRRRRKNLLAASSPHPITPRDPISRSGIPLTPISFAKLLNEFRSYFLLASLNYLMNLGAISYYIYIYICIYIYMYI